MPTSLLQQPCAELRLLCLLPGPAGPALLLASILAAQWNEETLSAGKRFVKGAGVYLTEE